MSWALGSAWPKIQVKRITTKIGSGKTPTGGSETYEAAGVLFLRSQNIHFDGIRLNDVVYISDETDREMASTRVRIDDSLLNITGASLGRVARVTSDLPRANVNQHVCIVRPRRSFDPRYLAWCLAGHPVQQQIHALQVGGNRDGLNFEQVGNLDVPLPPLDEQGRIADFLDAEAARIDLLVRQRTRQCDVLDELAPSMIDDTIQQMQKYRIVRLGYLAMVQTGVTVDGNRQQDGDIVTLPYLRVANVQAGYLDLDDIVEITVSRRVAAASRLRPGDVLMTEGGDLDKLGRGTVWHGEIEGCLHQNHVFAVRPHADVLTPDYLALLTQAPMARKYFESTGSKTTNLASTSSSKIRDFRIPLPDISAQRALVKEIEARLKWISDFEDQLSRQISRLAERRLALITAAVNGQIDVTTARGVSLPGGVGG